MVFIVRQERLDDTKRARLIDAAIEEFADHGFDAASYNKIIERSGLSKGTVYYYFDNKDSLLATVLEEICQRFSKAVGDLPLPETKEEYWSTDWEYHRRVGRFFSENPLLGRVMYWLSADEFHLDERLTPAHELAVSFMNKLIARGQELGAVRKDFPLETIERLMHAIGKVLSADIIGEDAPKAGTLPRDVFFPQKEEIEEIKGEVKEEMRFRIEKFMNMIHDLSQRLLAPEEVRHV
ncbi:MAG: TetR/AcrR family transcriptional regulator [Synergistaceae bacterium]|jgi:AcrR family transcriptional regulator|nr:TetR/AcrR family transcriptional regulator [Synergistaceae bacterium]